MVKDIWKRIYDKNRKPIIMLLGVGMAVVAAFASKSYIMSGRVNGDSMYPTLFDGDIFLFTEKSEYKRGDVVVFVPPEDAVLEGQDGSTFIKRVIANEGEHVKIEGNVVFVNGQVVDEPYVKENYSSDIDVTVPKGKIFVLGDNRDESRDSRDFGAIDKDTIVGKVYEFCLRK